MSVQRGSWRDKERELTEDYSEMARLEAEKELDMEFDRQKREIFEDRMKKSIKSSLKKADKW